MIFGQLAWDEGTWLWEIAYASASALGYGRQRYRTGYGRHRRRLTNITHSLRAMHPGAGQAWHIVIEAAQYRGALLYIKHW